MNNLDKLITLFESFPGVGARQAKRFAFHVLTMNDGDVAELAKLVETIKGSVVECDSCHRFFSKNGGEQNLCSICSANNREHERLLVVERDSDIQAIERAGVYNGLYFVLGGTVPLLRSADNERLRAGALKATVEARLKHGLSEIILGFSINPDGENTARFVESVLNPLLIETTIKISHLGRGLSTGSELEYADAETIKNALRNRY
ncbi:MAG: recombination protein RecR [Candidatus Pacebacteria bacterium]|nr:recombination protein RecR [Candidatus Paceibacterota bacterium]MBP9842796.1 recombination protein RecR [Candidatus Paceibacterota bacterium]